jgi:hypothetical protein
VGRREDNTFENLKFVASAAVYGNSTVLIHSTVGA